MQYLSSLTRIWDSWVLLKLKPISHVSLNTGVWALEMVNFVDAVELRPWEQIKELHSGFPVFQGPWCFHPVRQFRKTLNLFLIYCTEIWHTGNKMCKMVYNQVSLLDLHNSEAQVLREKQKISAFFQGKVCLVTGWGQTWVNMCSHLNCLRVTQGW